MEESQNHHLNSFLKLIKILIAIVLSLIFVLFGYMLGRNPDFIDRYILKVPFTPTPTPLPPLPLLTAIKTSQWQTYKNEVYQYSIKYPPTWSVQTAMTTARFAQELDLKQSIEAGYEIFVNVEKGDARTLKLREETQTEKYSSRSGFMKETVIVAGKTTQKFTGVGMDWPQMQTALTNGNYIFTITLAYFTHSFEEGQTLFPNAKNIYEQVLGTFQLSNPEDNKYSCPSTEYIDCMPKIMVDKSGKQPPCEKEYLQWVQKNCPSFKGVAY